MKFRLILSVMILPALMLNGAFMSGIRNTGANLSKLAAGAASRVGGQMPAVLSRAGTAGQQTMPSIARRFYANYAGGTQQGAQFGRRCAALLGGAGLGYSLYQNRDRLEEAGLLPQRWRNSIAFAAERESIYTQDARFNFNDILDDVIAMTINRASRGPGAELDSFYWDRCLNINVVDEQVVAKLVNVQKFIERDKKSRDKVKAAEAEEIYYILGDLIAAYKKEIVLFKLYREINSNDNATRQERIEKGKAWLMALDERAQFALELITKTKEQSYINDTLIYFKRVKLQSN